MSAAQQILELEERIKTASYHAQFAEGSDYSRDMRVVADLRAKLADLKEQQTKAESFDPFASNDADMWAEHDNEAIIERETANVIGPGVYHNLTNEQYHRSEGISKSGLDLIADNPSNYLWSKEAPVDSEKLAALDMGTALHCLLLEPDEFTKRFVQAPDVNKRTNAGKAEYAEFMESVKAEGKTLLEFEDHRKLMIMRESVMAHPVARMIFEAEGQNETSIYWIDKETGELCKCRPDRMVRLFDRPIIVDVKKVDGIERFPQHVADFRYHVQDAMYSDGYEQALGEQPLFWFLYASTTINCGRYPVDVRPLPDDWKLDGYHTYRENLNTYHQCRQSNDWLHLPEIKRPRWV